MTAGGAALTLHDCGTMVPGDLLLPPRLTPGELDYIGPGLIVELVEVVGYGGPSVCIDFTFMGGTVPAGDVYGGAWSTGVADGWGAWLVRPGLDPDAVVDSGGSS